jgi:6-phosphogluconolactonase
VRQTLQVGRDADDVARSTAGMILYWARRAEREDRPFRLALSGGKTPGPMFDWLVTLGLPWEQTEIYQVDERIAPEGHADRNLTDLLERFSGVAADVRPMPVEDADLDSAATRYAASLPERFDVIHLGIGPDGHTASLVPGDPVLEVTDRLVAVTGPYQGLRRMTLTYPALSRCDQLVWMVEQEDKLDALAKLLFGDPSVPAGSVTADRSHVCADPAAAGLPAGTVLDFPEEEEEFAALRASSQPSG